MPARIPDDERAAIASDLRAGMARRAVANKYGRSPTSVGMVAREVGFNFDRTDTKIATAARQSDMAERRTLLAARLLARAEQLERSLDDPHIAFNFGGKDNTYNEKTFDKPDVNAARTIITSAAILIDKHAVLIKIDSGEELNGTKSLLEALAGVLHSRHGDGSELVGDVGDE